MGKILVVDDDVTTLRVLGKIIKSSGHEPVLSRDASRALNILEDNADFSLLITDAAMPEMDGRALIEKIRDCEKLKHIPVIMVSGVISLRDITDLLERGVSRFMPKPIVAEDLKEYICKLATPKN
jgi:CheY-like chemotaxis protein